MKYFILTAVICIVLGLGYSLWHDSTVSKPVKAELESKDSYLLSGVTGRMTHADSIAEFIEWYEAMCDTVCTLTELREFKSWAHAKMRK